MKRCTIGYLLRKGKICIPIKKIKVGAGQHQAFGGKCEEADQTLEACLIREGREELLIEIPPGTCQYVAEIDFSIAGESSFNAHVFLVTTWMGEPQETVEIKPEWFDLEAIPYETMARGDRLWLPRILAGEKLKGRIAYKDRSLTEVTDHHFEPLI